MAVSFFGAGLSLLPWTFWKSAKGRKFPLRIIGPHLSQHCFIKFSGNSFYQILNKQKKWKRIYVIVINPNLLDNSNLSFSNAVKKFLLFNYILSLLNLYQVVQETGSWNACNCHLIQNFKGQDRHMFHTSHSKSQNNNFNLPISRYSTPPVFYSCIFSFYPFVLKNMCPSEERSIRL